MEQVTTDGKDSREDVVIYALKVSQHSTHSRAEFLCTHALPRPQSGRAQKADFQSFAKTLCDHEGLKSGVITSPAGPASGVAAPS
jgi:hypothetical protein